MGLDNAGKTTILKKFNGEDISTIEPTLGFNIKTLEYMGYKLNCWDVGGQQTIRSYWRNYFEVRVQRNVKHPCPLRNWPQRQPDKATLTSASLFFLFVCALTQQTDGLVWVVDSADRWRLEDCKRELHQLLGQEKLAGASLLIFANKQDLAGALSAADIAEVLDLGGEQIGSSRHWEIRGCSAVTGEGLVEGIDWLVKDISSRIFLMA